MKVHTSDKVDLLVQPELKKELVLLYQSSPIKDSAQFFLISNDKNKCKISHQLSTFSYSLTLNYLAPDDDIYIAVLLLNGDLWILTDDEYSSLL